MTWQPQYIKRFHECIESSTGVARVLTDAGEGYIKPLGNNVGPQALAREWIGTSLARFIGLQTFEFAIIFVAPEDEINLGHNCRALPGPAFITKKRNGFNWGGGADILEKVSNKGAFAKSVILDTLVLNQDRFPPITSSRKPNRDNVFLSESTSSGGLYDLISFDYSDCLRAPADLSPSIKNISNTKDENVYGLFPEFNEFITYDAVNETMKQLMTLSSSAVKDFLRLIPWEWQISEETKSALNDFLCTRVSFLSENIWQMISAIKGKLLV
jgi:hypothetical protein